MNHSEVSQANPILIFSAQSANGQAAAYTPVEFTPARSGRVRSLAFLSRPPGAARLKPASDNQRQASPIRASGRLLVKADHVSSRIAEPRCDLGRVRADRLDDLAPLGYHRVNRRGYTVHHDVKQEPGLCRGRAPEHP